MIDVFVPFSKIKGHELEVHFSEQEITSRKYQEKNGIMAFGVHANDPINTDVWVHEFSEWALAEAFPFRRNKNAIAHVMVSCHTVSGSEDYSLQTPEQFIKNLPFGKYNSVFYKPKPQKTLHRFFRPSINKQTKKRMSK